MKKWSLALVLFVAAGLALAGEPAREPVDYVNPLIGTHGGMDPSILYGGMYPAVAAPFAMIQWSPMTRENRIARVCYRYGDDAIMGFIGTRQPAIWMGDYGGVSLMPSTGKVRTGFEERKLKYRHRDEVSTPYYYAVTAEGVKTEMTAYSRGSLFRVIFPEGESGHVVIDASRFEGFKGWVEVQPDRRRVIGYNTDRLSAHLGPPLPNFKGWFVVEFDREFTGEGTYAGETRTPGKLSEEGDSIGAWVEFGAGGGGPLMMRVGTSLISLEQAETNLDREIPWDFDYLESALKSKWNEQLGRIEVEGSEDDKTIFYTAMYHSHLFPREFSETGRYYSAFDDQVHEGVSYNDYSLWDTFRAEHPLLILTAPERVPDMITSLLQMYEEGGWLPKWPNPTYTGIMIGSHADSVIADAWVKGVRGFDLQKAYAAGYKDAMTPPDGDREKRWHDRAPWTSVESRGGLSWYKELGYVPVDKTDESVSRTLEFAYDDFCVAQLARAAGHPEDYELFMKRSRNYRNLYRDGALLARNSDGSWAGKKGYTESVQWGYLFCAMQDIPGLIDLMGGDRAFERKLDQVFAPVVRWYRYIHMNEPMHHYPYLYDYCGAPWKTQRLARVVMREYYGAKPTGLLGTDDCGQMSAWFIFSSLGFYPVTPGSDVYALGSPLWDRAVIHLGGDKPTADFVVIARNQGPRNYYVQSVTLNGNPLPGPFLKHEDLTAGGELVFTMGPTPNRGLWASAQ